MSYMKHVFLLIEKEEVGGWQYCGSIVDSVKFKTIHIIFINIIIKEDDNTQDWRLTGFYGIPQRG